MNLRIVNDTSYKKMRITCDNKSVILKKNESTTLSLDSPKSKIQNEYINVFLSQKEAILRENNGEEPPVVPTNFVEKAIFKVVDKIFKRR